LTFTNTCYTGGNWCKQSSKHPEGERLASVLGNCDSWQTGRQLLWTAKQDLGLPESWMPR